jgi:ParB family chromosome partitioning protein
LTQEQIAARTGKDRASVGNYVRLLRLPEQVQQMVEREELTFGHARALMALAVGAIPAAAKKVVEEAFSVRQTEDMVKELLAPHEAEKKSKANERPVDPNVRAAERQLQEALGTRVRILDRKGKGKVVIEYASLEDFDRIIEALSK